MNYEVGQILVDNDGDERKILAVCGDLVAYSFCNEHSLLAGWKTKQKIEQMGWKLKEEPWVPKGGEVYWYVDGVGNVCGECWDNHETDAYLLRIGNCFRTESEAKAYRQWLIDHPYKPV